MNSCHVILPELSLSTCLKKSCNSGGESGSFKAMHSVASSFFSMVPLLSLSNWLKMFLIASMCAGDKANSSSSLLPDCTSSISPAIMSIASALASVMLVSPFSEESIRNGKWEKLSLSRSQNFEASARVRPSQASGPLFRLNLFTFVPCW